MSEIQLQGQQKATGWKPDDPDGRDRTNYLKILSHLQIVDLKVVAFPDLTSGQPQCLHAHAAIALVADFSRSGHSISPQVPLGYFYIRSQET